MVVLASDCLVYFRLLLWNDFNNILQEASNYKMYNVPNQLVFLLVQHNNYTIVLVSYLFTRFQFLRKYCTDYKQNVREVGTILN